MLTAGEITRSVYGVWRLAHLDPGGMSFLDTTLDGLWRSFRLSVLLLPVFLVLIALRQAVHPAEADLVRLVAVELIAYALGWIAFPLAAWHLVGAMGRMRAYDGYIVAYNWSTVIQLAGNLAVLGLAALGLLPGPMLDAVGLAVFGLLLYFAWFIARTALGIGGWPAAGLVAVDVLIGFLLAAIEGGMVY